MRLAKTMNAEQFAELLFNLEIDEVVEFGLEKGYFAEENKPLETYNVECWFFAKRMRIDGYDSEFILIDYCGGGMPYVVPADIDFSRDMMNQYGECAFRHLENCGCKVDEVYVDMGESEE